jgi:hypothetical protein
MPTDKLGLLFLDDAGRAVQPDPVQLDDIRPIPGTVAANGRTVPKFAPLCSSATTRSPAPRTTFVPLAGVRPPHQWVTVCLRYERNSP